MIDRLEEVRSALEDPREGRDSERVEGVSLASRILEKVFPDERFDINPVLDEGWRWNAQIAISELWEF